MIKEQQPKNQSAPTTAIERSGGPAWVSLASESVVLRSGRCCFRAPAVVVLAAGAIQVVFVLDKCWLTC